MVVGSSGRWCGVVDGDISSRYLVEEWIFV